MSFERYTISELTEDENLPRQYTFIYHVDTNAQVNFLRRAMYNYVECYSTFFATFYINNSALDDEEIAHRMGMIIVDNDKLRTLLEDGSLSFLGGDDPNTAEDIVLNLNVAGFGYATTEDIENSPYIPTNIIPLREGEEVVADLILRKAVGADHSNYQPICKFICSKVEKGDGYFVTCRTIGMLGIEEIIEQGIEWAIKMEKFAVENV
jgi:hypothetical protein